MVMPCRVRLLSGSAGLVCAMATGASASERTNREGLMFLTASTPLDLWLADPPVKRTVRSFSMPIRRAHHRPFESDGQSYVCYGTEVQHVAVATLVVLDEGFAGNVLGVCQYWRAWSAVRNGRAGRLMIY